ncbi:MAG: YfhO family protein [Acidobacteria bacterium]|nr:YfhO family protein [Acidobacteriota bacterium]MCI0718498.1 YfhO family protein [Acidobacteriota bacterium]
MKSIHSDLLCLLVLSVVLVGRQFGTPHFVSCVIDDSILQMSWASQFGQLLQEGQLLPRWLPQSNGGFGSPVFVFYSPLVYYATAPWLWLTQSVVLSMKIVRLLGLCLSGVAMHRFLSGLTDRKTALAGAIVYLALPFHVLDISYWSLYAEPWAWIWFPLILHCLTNALEQERERRLWWLRFSVTYAALVLTHLVSAYMFSFVIAAYVLSASQASSRLRNLKDLAGSVLIAMALAALYLLPAVYEQRFVHIEYSTMLSEFDFRNTLLFFPDPVLMGANPFQARTIWLEQAVVLLQGAWGATGAALFFVLADRRGELRRHVMFAALLCAGCVFLMSRASIWLWELVPGLAKIQFSTRWLSVFTLGSALLITAGFQVYSAGANGWRQALKLGHMTLGFAAGVATLLVILGSCFLSEEHTRMARQHLYNAPEYNPRSMVRWKERILYPQLEECLLLEGKAKIKVLAWKTRERRVAVDAASLATIKLRVFDYPGWEVSLNGQRITPEADPADGGMTVRLPAGKHELSLRFVNTWWRNAALGISGAAAAVVAAVWWIERKRWANQRNLSSPVPLG